jgi:integrase
MGKKIVGHHLIADDKAIVKWLATEERFPAGHAKAGQPKAIRNLADGGGLVLQAFSDGKTRPGWRFNYTFPNEFGVPSAKTISLGTYPETGLANARAKAQAAHDQLNAVPPVDPSAARKSAAAVDAQAFENTERAARGEAPVNSFEDVARRLHAQNGPKKKWGPKQAGKFMQVCRDYWFPAIGRIALDKLDDEALKPALAAMREDKLQTAKRMVEFASQVFVYGRNQVPKLCRHDWTLDLKGFLPKHEVVHHPKIKDPIRLGQLLRAIDADAKCNPTRAAATLLQVMLFQRPGNTVAMRWEEIVWRDGMWLIPADKMKKRRDHAVPLSKQALALLSQRHADQGRPATGWVFATAPGQLSRQLANSRSRGYAAPKGHLHTGTVLECIRSCGFGSEEANGHGMRGTAQTMINQKVKGFDAGTKKLLTETQLAHRMPGLGDTYDEADFVEDRVALVQAWADLLDKARDMHFDREEAAARAKWLAETGGVQAANEPQTPQERAEHAA